MARVREGQLPRPRVVDHVDAAGGGRIAAQRRPVVPGGRERPAPVVKLPHDVGGRLLILRERPERRAQLAHDRRRPRAAALHVADDDAHPPGRQRDDVVPVAADLGLDALPMRFQRFRRDVPAGHLEPVKLRDGLRQQALLEGQRGLPFGLEQHRVVDRDGHPAGDRADQIAVEGVVAAVIPVGEPRQGQAHHAEQFPPGVQRRRHHGGQAGLVSGGHALRARGRIVLGLQVGDRDRLQARHRLLAEVTLRVVDLLAGLGPGAGRRHPVVRVPLHAADELVTLEQVDEAVVGELRHEHLGHVLQGGTELEGAGQPLADALEQRDHVLPPLAIALAGLADQDHHPVDVTARVPQRYRETAHERVRSVCAGAGERVLPPAAAQHLPGEILHLAQVIVGEQAQGKHRATGQP